MGFSDNDIWYHVKMLPEAYCLPVTSITLCVYFYNRCFVSVNLTKCFFVLPHRWCFYFSVCYWTEGGFESSIKAKVSLCCSIFVCTVHTSSVSSKIYIAGKEEVRKILLYYLLYIIYFSLLAFFCLWRCFQFILSFKGHWNILFILCVFVMSLNYLNYCFHDTRARQGLLQWISHLVPNSYRRFLKTYKNICCLSIGWKPSKSKII